MSIVKKSATGAFECDCNDFINHKTCRHVSLFTLGSPMGDWLNSHITCEWRYDYSGRGMFGSISLIAFVSDIHPNSKYGKMLSRFFTVDSMGLEFVYYTKNLVKEKPCQVVITLDFDHKPSKKEIHDYLENLLRDDSLPFDIK